MTNLQWKCNFLCVYVLFSQRNFLLKHQYLRSQTICDMLLYGSCQVDGKMFQFIIAGGKFRSESILWSNIGLCVCMTQCHRSARMEHFINIKGQRKKYKDSQWFMCECKFQSWRLCGIVPILGWRQGLSASYCQWKCMYARAIESIEFLF